MLTVLICKETITFTKSIEVKARQPNSIKSEEGYVSKRAAFLMMVVVTVMVTVMGAGQEILELLQILEVIYYYSITTITILLWSSDLWSYISTPIHTDNLACTLLFIYHLS
jgi:hypothetical protein